MTTATINSQSAERVRISGKRLLWVGPLAIVGALAANAVVRAIELAVLPIPAAFDQLQSPAFVFLTLAGVLGAVITYAVIGRVSRRPARTFRIVAAVALVLSFLPDLGLLLTGAPGATLVSVLALIVLHIVAAVIAVGVLTGLA